MASGRTSSTHGRWITSSARASGWILLVALLGLVSTASVGDEAKKPSGTVRVEQYQVAFIGSGNLGGGVLEFDGKRHAFSIGGLGVGGIGVSKIEATGNVYNLTRLRDFAGAYIQTRYGLAAGEASTGRLWLENRRGVVIGLDADRTGLALSVGGDAVYIDLD